MIWIWIWMNMKCEWDEIEYVNYMELNSRWKWCEWYMIMNGYELKLNWKWKRYECIYYNVVEMNWT